MKKFEIQILLYNIDKNILGYMLNIFGIILFYKVLGWFDGQNIGVEPRRPRFNPLYQHILCGICTFVFIPYTCM
jgi:hypothetical protein